MSLRVERDDGVAVLTLDRADVLNAFDEALTSALSTALTEVAGDAGVRAVVITGAGRAFSAGQDLRDRAAALELGAELRLGDELRRRYHPVIRTIRAMRKPVIGAVNGIASGAGFGLVAACDVRVASAAASFRAGWGRVAAWPQQGLGDDRGSFVDGQRGRAVQLVPKFQGLADAIAERSVVRPGKHAITGKPVGRHVGESRRGRADPAVSRR